LIELSNGDRGVLILDLAYDSLKFGLVNSGPAIERKSEAVLRVVDSTSVGLVGDPEEIRVPGFARDSVEG
jgi:hypothetical protein